jgi:hypothetical protein
MLATLGRRWSLVWGEYVPGLLANLGPDAVSAMVLAPLSLAAIVAVNLIARYVATRHRRFEIRTTCEELRRAGVARVKIQSYALSAAKKPLSNPVIEVLQLLIQLVRQRAVRSP